MSDLLDLGAEDSVKALNTRMAALFGAQELYAAEKLIDRGFRAKPSPFADVCRSIGPNDVRIAGWDRVHASIIQLAQRGKACTAYGIDLSPHSETDEPLLECSYYDDSSFVFSIASDAEILSAYGVTPGKAPWLGSFLDCDCQLTITGLAELYQLRLRTSRTVGGYVSPAMLHYEGYILAEWFLHLRVHQAIRRDLAKHGMPQAMPVIVAENDFQPHVISVYRAAKVDDLIGAATRIIEPRRTDARDSHARHTAKTIAEIRQRRSDYRALASSTERDEFAAFFRLVEKFQLDAMQMPTELPTWEMPDQMFEAFVERYRASRQMQ